MAYYLGEMLIMALSLRISKHMFFILYHLYYYLTEILVKIMEFGDFGDS